MFFRGNVQHLVCIRRKEIDGYCRGRARINLQTGVCEQTTGHNHCAEWNEQKRDVIVNEAIKDLESDPTRRDVPKVYFTKARSK